MKKRLLYSLLIGASMYLVSCMEIDNVDAPDAKIEGRVIDRTTGENIITDHANSTIRIWEMSYSENPAPQGIPVQHDGTYNNDRLFAGTYDMLPYNGPWYPADTLRNVKIGKKKSSQDFIVVPYLRVTQFEAVLNGLNLTMTCRLELPKNESGNPIRQMRVASGEMVELPQILEVRPFLSLIQYVGASNRIDEYWNNNYRVNLRRGWDAIDADGDGVSDAVYSITVPLKAGYTYRVRMGANVNDTHQQFNYTEIKTIVVPNN